MSFYYLATPYSQYPHGRPAAFEDAAAQAALLIEAGVPIFCPITHSHPISTYLAPQFDTHDSWMRVDDPMMRAAKGLIVCELEGWEASRGVRQEIETFQAAGKPTVHMTPGVVPQAVLPRNRKIVGLCGYARSGKDEAAKALVSAGWTRVAFADAVREALLALDPPLQAGIGLAWCVEQTGWEPQKSDPIVRRLLQRLGTEVGRKIFGEDCWVNIARRKLDAVSGNVVITDCRFANEAAMIRELGGIVVRIDRPGVGPVNGHASEQLAFEADELIVNDGTIQDLHDHILLLADPAEVEA